MNDNIKVDYVHASSLIMANYNPRTHTKEQSTQLRESIRRFGLVDPAICNKAAGRENIIIGGHFRVEVAKELGITEIPVVYVNIPELEREKELNLRLNKNTGNFDLELLREFDETFLHDVGFTSEDIDNIFPAEENPETFDLEKELEKLNIKEITIQKGDVYDLDGSKLMCGDSTIEEDVLRLVGNEKVDAVITDPPYILDYLKGKKKNGEATEGFGLKRNRRYLETDVIPPDFTQKWMANVSKVQKENFHILVYENWKNIRTIWGEMEKHWKVKNMIVWHLSNRTQGYAAKYKFFSKHDIAMVGSTNETPELNVEPEAEEMLQNEYETALYAISGKPHWEGYAEGKKNCPTDFIEYKASDEKSSGQGIVFGTKPTEILIPYIKILTKRGDLVLEPFGGSGSTLIASTKMNRRCFIMEKSPVYAEVIRNRWERITGKKAVKL